MMIERFTGMFERDGEWWIGYAAELPGANTQGRTLEEVRENLKDAVKLLLETNRDMIQRETKGKDVVQEELTVSLE